MSDMPSIRILSAGAPKTGVRQCAEAWRDKSGRPFAIAFATAPAIEERVGRNAADADVIVAPAPAMAEFVEAGRVVAGSVVPIGAIAAGVAVRAGAATPDLSSVDAFSSALLDADALIYNQASSGQYIATMIERLGIAAEVADKTVLVANGAAVMEHLAADRRERTIGFGQVTEIRLHEHLGIRLVGPLPAAIGKVTAYAAGVSSTAADRDGAAALVAFMASDEGRAILSETGVG
jgi:molybdate transport system substrate-binding protein